MMLSTVAIVANGDTGDETMVVELDGKQVFQTKVATQQQTYKFDVASTAQVSDLRILFTNDLYLPGQGIDRNLNVQSISIDGSLFNVDSNEVFSTGTWTASDGITPGTGRGNTLHTDGFFDFSNVMQSTIGFAEQTWEGSSAFTGDQVNVDSSGKQLQLNGSGGAIALSQEVEIKPDTTYELTVDAFRMEEKKATTATLPFATVGVNFYDSTGKQVGQSTIDVNNLDATPDKTAQSEMVKVGKEATTAFLWVWIDEDKTESSSAIVVNDLSFNEMPTVVDFAPPTATLPTTLVFNESPGKQVDFIVQLNDDIQLGTKNFGLSPSSIRVIGPGGFNKLAVDLGSVGPSSNNVGLIQFGLTKPDGSVWNEFDNGIYVIYLDNNALVDDAGNSSLGGVVGTFELAIAKKVVSPIPS
ncbi:MAG: carbohydrate-binding domain-containing protein [Planctomycetota bacterium]